MMCVDCVCWRGLKANETAKRIGFVTVDEHGKNVMVEIYDCSNVTQVALIEKIKLSSDLTLDCDVTSPMILLSNNRFALCADSNIFLYDLSSYQRLAWKSFGGSINSITASSCHEDLAFVQCESGHGLSCRLFVQRMRTVLFIWPFAPRSVRWSRSLMAHWWMWMSVLSLHVFWTKWFNLVKNPNRSQVNSCC